MNNDCSTAVTSCRFHFVIVRDDVYDTNYEKYNFKVKRKPRELISSPC